MNLIGLRVGAHDSNITFYDGSKLRYYKSERRKQIKHHEINGVYDWRQDIKEVWGLDYRDIDQMAVSLDEDSMAKYYGDLLYNDWDGLYRECSSFPAPCKVWSIDHHYAHSLSMSPLITPDVSIVMDGIGDYETPWSVFKGDTLVERGDINTTGSIGLLMNELGKFLGIKYIHETDIAGKVMGIQSYGKFDQEYFDLLEGSSVMDAPHLFNIYRWYKHKGHDLLGRHTSLDWINTVHKKTGYVLLDFFKKYCKPSSTIFYSGGVAQNVIWNTLLKEHYKNLVILPHSADEGISIGAVEWLRRKNKLKRIEFDSFPFNQSDEAPIDEPTEETINKVAEYLAQGKTVAWYQGHGEIGPRALGNRSILMDPRLKNGREVINVIKKREQYRPFGASVLKEQYKEHFDMPSDNPYMLYVGNVKSDSFPAITHVDGTCRVQTVDKDVKHFRPLLEKFFEKTGCPVLLNTSLNLGGKPIAGYTHNVEELFENSNLDYAVIGNIILSKESK